VDALTRPKINETGKMGIEGIDKVQGILIPLFMGSNGIAERGCNQRMRKRFVAMNRRRTGCDGLIDNSHTGCTQG
jgi:hypothetical protein